MSAARSVVVCLACGLDFDAMADAAEAAHMAGVHNDLQHGCSPVAFTAEVAA